MFPSLPSLLLGIILAAYWGRVLRMAYKARRRTGRAGNMVPTEKIGRWLRVIWAPAVMIWVGYPFVAALVTHLPDGLRPLYYLPIVQWAAVVVAGVCLASSWTCWKTMGQHWRMGIDPGEQNPLIASGPFARVRHPIYALSILMMLASVAVVPSILMFAVALVHILLLVWEARREEAHLLKVHGSRYAEYQQKAGRFFPMINSR